MDIGNCTHGFTEEKDPHWNRRDIAGFVSGFEQAAPEVSQREFAREHHIPRSTLQFWIVRKRAIDLPPPLAAFFESTTGVEFLHRLLVAMHLVFDQDANCGLRRIVRFLELTQLDRVIGASYGTQYNFGQAVGEEIVRFGQHEQQQLASQMPSRQITVCEDETFHPKPCLVAIEPSSGFVLLEAYRDRRDAQTWNQTLSDALKGLPVQVIQSVSDEAKALLAHAADQNAHHSPDLFHVQQELSRGTTLSLRAQTQQAEQTVVELGVLAQHAAAARDACQAGCPDSSVVGELASKAERAQQTLAAAKTHADTCRQREEQTRQARRGLSDDYHPFDLDTGVACEANEVQRRLQQRFDQIEKNAGEAGLSESSHKRIAKARRVMPAMVATLALFWRWVRERLLSLSLSPEQELAFLEQFLPAAYLSVAAPKAATAARRLEIQAVAEQLTKHARDGPLSELSEARQTELHHTAAELAVLFQRSSSCVEGRNGHLALWHHSRHRLSPQRLQSLTVLANFFHRRPDGTTAAERFFATAPSDLFEWLLAHVALPARPASSRLAT